MTQKVEDNPFIKASNPYQQYNENIKKLRNAPEVVQFDRMCFELFEATDLGKQFMEFVLQNFLLNKFAEVSHPNYSEACIYYEGFREAFRVLRQATLSHKQRIAAAVNEATPGVADG